ncbi:MAG: hypothetical protein U0931_21665 [Vulcanimicrobiota bacterium]
MSDAAAPETEESSAPTGSMTLEERVAYLEAQNEGLKRVGLLGLVLVLMLGAIVVHQTYSDLRSTTTRGLTLLNEKDELSGAVTVDAQGRTQFVQARYGNMASLNPLPEGFQGFAFYDTAGTPRVLIGETKDQQTFFKVIDPSRKLVFDPFEGMQGAPAPTPNAEPGKAPATKGSPTPKPTP